MNCEEVKEKINIRTVLESFNLSPVKENNMVMAKKMITKAQNFYSENKFIKDSYSTPQDKIFEKNIFFLQKKLQQ